jgi:DNA end-binding protein Ku
MPRRDNDMPRSIWNGVISFGMVSIPVKLYTATQSKDISFHLLHKDDGARLQQLRWCPEDDRKVEWGEVVRGYEYAKDQHVILTEEDFEKLPLPSKQTVELSAFVKAEEIDPVFYEKSYYLEPDAKGIKPFALLMTALKEKQLTGIAKIAVRNKEQLCALRPMDGTLILETLYYPDEIRVEKTELPDVKVSDKELDMAYTLIELLTEDFDPEKYHDEYRKALMQVIDAKLEGEELPEVAAAGPAKVTDIMSALRASVEAAKKRKKGEEEDEEEPARRRKAG